MIENHSMNIFKVKNIKKRLRSIKIMLMKVTNKRNKNNQNSIIDFLNKFKEIKSNKSNKSKNCLMITVRNNMYIMFLKSKVNKRKNNQKMEN